MDKNNSYDFSSLGLLQFALRKWKPLIIFPVIMFVLSAGISLTIKNKFKSSVILFPAAQTSISKILLSMSGGGEDGITTIGEEEQAENLLQVLHSEHIRSKIIEKYDLMNHYKINPNDKYKFTKLHKKYKKNIKFRRTEFMSIEISAMDEDPQMAADIANDIAALLDSTMIYILKERGMKAFEIVENEYLNLARQVSKLEDSLEILGSLGIYDPEMQAQALSEAYSQTVVKGDAKAAGQLQKEIDILAKYGSRFTNIMVYLEFEKENLSNLRSKYIEAKVDAEQKVPHKFVVDSAFKAERKTYPKRSLIVFFSTLSTFILTFLVLLVAENLKEFKKA